MGVGMGGGEDGEEVDVDAEMLHMYVDLEMEDEREGPDGQAIQRRRRATPGKEVAGAARAALAFELGPDPTC
ncbi:hypothetical protein D9615_007021 [Tricholomella constricta]|uniref:Uncharacterized protein n=1 Tax=Tricholomella constricta TaxID=117010 RepID=A0A8H5H8M6_9AGAR|nr:hypothetical protein D9615_007021 [Tricholomella constricta]